MSESTREFERAGRKSGRCRRARPRAAQARQRLATWVRELGVSDRNISPDHAWRHTFADRAGISERMSDYITGHAPKSVGAGYGAPMLDDMATALKKFPRYTGNKKPRAVAGLGANEELEILDCNWVTAEPQRNFA